MKWRGGTSLVYNDGFINMTTSAVKVVIEHVRDENGDLVPVFPVNTVNEVMYDTENNITLKQFLDENAGAGDSVIESVNLLSSGWTLDTSTNKYYYTLTNANITTTNIIEMIEATTATDAQLSAMIAANIVGGEQTAGQLILVARGVQPTMDLPVVFIFRADT